MNQTIVSGAIVNDWDSRGHYPPGNGLKAIRSIGVWKQLNGGENRYFALFPVQNQPFLTIF